jgi:cobalt/nickel transport system permease protein
MIIIDKLCYHSGLRYENASVKMFFSLTTLGICVLSRSICVSQATLISTGYLTLVKGKIPWKYYRKLMAVPLIFLLLSTLAIWVDFSTVPMDAYAIRIGKLYLTNSWNQIVYGCRLICVALAAISCLYFLACNTTMTDILGTLHRMHVPSLLVELLMLVYRYIFILLDIAGAIRDSQRSRLGNKDYRTSINSFAKRVSILFVRAIKKADLQYMSLEARGFDGTLRVLQKHYPIKCSHLIGVILFEIFLAGLAVIVKIF